MKASRNKSWQRWRAHSTLLALVAGIAQAAPADTPPEPAAQVAPDWAREPAPAAAGADARPFKSHGAAALQILAFQVLLNRFDNAYFGSDYGVSMGSIRRNLHNGWVEDRDPFEINQMGHPYQGSVYFGHAN